MNKDFDINQLNFLTPNIAITSWETANKINVLSKFNANINICEKPKDDKTDEWIRKNENFSYIWISIPDSPSENISFWFEPTEKLISHVLSKGGKVLVNCMAGISRSSTIILNYIIQSWLRDNDPEQIKIISSVFESKNIEKFSLFLIKIAIEEFRKIRPISPNPGFLKQLNDYTIQSLNKLISNSQNQKNDEDDKKNENFPTSLNLSSQSIMTTCNRLSNENGRPAAVIYLGDKDFDSNGKLVSYPDVNGVIMIGADWCGHCKMLKPEFAKFADKVKGSKTQAFYIDSETGKNLLSRINPKVWGWTVRGFPTVVGYFQGQFYSEYAADKANPAAFRTAPDLVEYAEGLGKAEIQHVPS